MRLLRRSVAILAWALLLLAGGSIAAGLLLAARLDAGPLPVTGIVRRLLVSADLPLRVQVGRATLSWNGESEGLAAPLLLSLDRFAVADAGGRVLDHVAHAAIALSPRALLAGRIAPFSVEADGGALRLRRRADGFVELAPGVGVGPGPAAGPARPGGAPFLHWIRLLRLEAVDLDVDDREAGFHWGAADASAILARAGANEALAGRAGATLLGGPARAHLQAALLPGADGASTLRARLGPVDPSVLPPVLPALRAVAAPVTAVLTATVGRDLAVRDIRFDLGAGAGKVGGIPVRSARVVVRLQPAPDATLARPGGAIELERAELVGGDGATVAVTGSLRGGSAPGATLAGTLTVTGDAIPFAGLADAWPAGLARGARQWITGNITAGAIHALRVEATVASTDGLDGIALTGLAGGFAGDGLTVHWLRPVAPITDGRATLRFTGPDALAIAVAGGREGALVLDGSSLRITGLAAHDQLGAIDLRVAGPLADLLTLLAAPRLHLLSRHPLPFDAPAGTVAARVGLTLPLDAHVTTGAIGITVAASLAAVHLGDLALGRPLEDGALTLDADADGLRVGGTGRFAGLPVTGAARFDFRAGGPAQVVESADVSTRATPAALLAAGLPVGEAGPASGTVGLAAHWRERRDGSSAVAASADLTAAALQLPVGWSKRAGEAGEAHVALALRGDRITSVGALGASGPDLDIATHGEVVDGIVRAIVLDRVHVGRTRLAGRIDLPQGPGGAWRITANGPVLDLGWRFSGGGGGEAAAAPVRPAVAPVAPAAGAGPAGPRWEVGLTAGRVDLANAASFADVHARFDGLGTRVVRGDARAAGTGALVLALAPVPGGRALRVSSDDAGRLLAATDLSRRVHGGTLVVAARLPDATAPVTGTLRMQRFRIDRVPAAARMLRDLTLYGLADPAPAKGISVDRLVLPFSWAPDGTVTLDDARAFQSALGVTARGSIDTRGGAISIRGTIVPAYLFNALPGRLPIVGRLFSPERGGGLFAATYAVTGTLAAPRVSVNPLAALLPGMLRDLFNR